MQPKEAPRESSGKAVRTYVRLDADERRKIDFWGFERHIPSRSERLRTLIFKGLEAEAAGAHRALRGECP
jgi:hypothetical protein